jgi:hypothetical protein
MGLRFGPISEDLYLFLYFHNLIPQSLLPSFNPWEGCLAQLDGYIYLVVLFWWVIDFEVVD